MPKSKNSLTLLRRVTTSVLLVSFSSTALLSCANNTQLAEEEQFENFQARNKLKRLTKENQKERTNFEEAKKRLQTVEGKKENLDSNFLGRLRSISKSLIKGEESLKKLQGSLSQHSNQPSQDSSSNPKSSPPSYKTFAEGVKKHQRLLEQQALLQNQLLQAKKLQKLLSTTKKHFFKIKTLFEETEKVYSELAKGEALVDLALNNLLGAQKNN